MSLFQPVICKSYHPLKKKVKKIKKAKQKNPSPGLGRGSLPGNAAWTDGQISLLFSTDQEDLQQFPLDPF